MLAPAVIKVTFDNLATAGVYVLGAFILFFIGKMLYDFIHRGIDVDHELVEKDNFAFAYAQVGYYAGLLLAIGGSIVGESTGDIVEDLINTGIFGLLGIIILNLSIVINDRLLLPKFNVRKEIIDDQNAGTGVIEGAVAIANGLIIYHAFSVEGGNFTVVIGCWAIAQVMLWLTGIVYNAITPYNIHDEIEKDNVAVGVGYAGAIIALANLIGFSIHYEFENWEDTVINMAIDTALGLILLPVARFLTDKVLLPKRKITDEIVNQERPNVGVAAIEAFAYIGGSVLITWCLA